jgi:glycosyltransferase involved in cell wall biosynthesis
MYGLKHAGIGRYVENLVNKLLAIDDNNQYILFVRKEDEKWFRVDVVGNNREKVKIVVVDAKHYSLKEQVIFPYILFKQKVDLMHFPHFNVPILYRGKYIVTIHDLLWHDTKGGGVTTLSPFFYTIKYLGYRIVFSNAVKRAIKILTPSNWVKNKLLIAYHIDSNNIHVVYEGIADRYLQKNDGLKDIKQKASILLKNKFNITKPFFIYTGSAYPHKNLEILLLAMVEFKDYQLVIACARDVFWEKLKVLVLKYSLTNQIRLLGFVPDEEIKILYKEAAAFIFPSLNEGFGLPGIEAMACGCPVISSNRTALMEIYRNAALYFDPLNVVELKGCMKKILNLKTKSIFASKGYLLIKQYNWLQTAKETLKVYESCFSL